LPGERGRPACRTACPTTHASRNRPPCLSFFAVFLPLYRTSAAEVGVVLRYQSRAPVTRRLWQGKPTVPGWAYFAGHDSRGRDGPAFWVCRLCLLVCPHRSPPSHTALPGRTTSSTAAATANCSYQPVGRRVVYSSRERRCLDVRRGCRSSSSFRCPAGPWS